MTDPNYKDNLVKFFKSKGFKYKDIDAWMERNQIDKKINDAKAENYADLYYRALASGKPITASAVLSQLAPINPQMAASIMATTPSYKDSWNVNNARENAMTAYEMKQKADEANYKRQLARDRQQAEIKAWLNNQSFDLKTKQYLQQLDARRRVIAQMYGEDYANQWFGNAVQGINQSGNKSNNNAKNNADDIFGTELKASDIKTYTELADAFDADKANEGKPNPYRERLNRNSQIIHDKENNNYIIPPNTINNSDDAYHNASVVIDWAREGRFGGKPNKEGVLKLIEQVVGDYAPAIIEQYKNDPEVLADFE